MSEEKKKLYTDRRWTDIPKPRVIHCPPPTEEERKAMDERAEAFFRKKGILKEGQKLEDISVD